MQYVNAFLCLLFALCAIAQYNDPDALLWIMIYATPAAWAGAIAFRPSLLSASRPAGMAFLACLAAAIVGTIYLWPSLPENWIRMEEEREAIGLMIVTAGLAVVGWTGWRAHRVLPPGHAAPR
jgi:Transmembrane family 220, helix